MEKDFPFGLIRGLESYLNRNLSYFGHWSTRCDGPDANFILETFVPGKGVVKSVVNYKRIPNLYAAAYIPATSENVVPDLLKAIRVGFDYFHWMVE